MTTGLHIESRNFSPVGTRGVVEHSEIPVRGTPDLDKKVTGLLIETRFFSPVGARGVVEHSEIPVRETTDLG
jgi:hypothetical protein